MREQTRIATRCPACNSSTLFIANGNWLTCSLIGCPDPTLINSTGERLKAHREDKQKAEQERDALREQNRVLREAAQQAMDLIHEDIVQGDKAGRRLKAEAILWNALTATSREGQHG